MSITNAKYTDLGAKPGYHGDRLVTDRLSYSMAAAVMVRYRLRV